MKYIFYWEAAAQGARPHCDVRPRPSGEISPMSSLLMDDGGLDTSASLSWIAQGLQMADRALADPAFSGSWDREDWGAKVSHDRISVYSLHDDQCNEEISTQKFREILNSWQEFLAASNASDEVEVES